MFKWLSRFRSKPQVVPEPPAERKSYFSTDFDLPREQLQERIATQLSAIVKAQPDASPMGSAMDDSSDGYPDFKLYLGTSLTPISEAIQAWYSSQTFIGWQLCGIIAQHWLVRKACEMPALDAIRNGWDIVSADGEDMEPDDVKAFHRIDRKFGVKACLREYLTKGRIFGIRIAMFKVESTDPEYYEKPFNIDGITAGSYKGIVQVDPYWCAPQLDGMAAAQPSSLHFYEPTWWIISGKKVHRSHLVIYRHCEPIDILKPVYMYGGVPLPQMIMERVWAAERTANEGPQLAMTKRTNVWLTDMAKIMADPDTAIHRLNQWAAFRDNYGVKLGDKSADEFQQFDTTLSDVDALIGQQYRLVAAAANVPSAKIMGESLKGFNAEGAYEEASYHEYLESTQEHDLTPFLERHYAIAARSEGINAPDVTISWKSLDAPTAKELADTNLVRAQTGAALIQSGAIDGEDERSRVAMDPDSGYHNLGARSVEELNLDDDEESTDGPAAESER